MFPLNFIFAGYDRIPSLVMVRNTPRFAHTTYLLLISLCINTYQGNSSSALGNGAAINRDGQYLLVCTCMCLYTFALCFITCMCTCIGVYAFVCLFVEIYISRPGIFLFVLNLIFIYLRQDLSPNLELSDLEALASKSPRILHLPASSFLLLRL